MGSLAHSAWNPCKLLERERKNIYRWQVPQDVLVPIYIPLPLTWALPSMGTNIVRIYTPADQMNNLFQALDQKDDELGRRLDQLECSLAAAASLGHPPGMRQPNTQPPPNLGPQTFSMTPPGGSMPETKAI